MADRPFHDRRDAGRALAALLDSYRDTTRVEVLALPRGGVPVGYEVALALGAHLDVFLVHRIAVPTNGDLTMGAIATGGELMLDVDVVRDRRIAPATIQRAAERAGRDLARRERAYRGWRPLPDVGGKTVILVDDGMAIGAGMRAAVLTLRRWGPAQIVVAVPTAPEAACEELRALVDDVVCATTPSPFISVDTSYRDYPRVTDEEVRELLRPTTAPI